MRPLVPELEELLVKTGRRQAEAESTKVRSRWPRRRMFLAVTVAGLLVAAAGAGAARLVTWDSRPAPAPRQAEAFEPRPGSVTIDVEAVDPDGGLPWQLRTWEMPDGAYLCAQAGRTVEGAFGLLFPSGTFLPLHHGDNTGPDCAPGSVTGIRLVDDPHSTQPALWRTIIHGVVARPPVRTDDGRLNVTVQDGRDRSVPREDVKIRITARSLTYERPVGDRGGWLVVLPGDIRWDEITATLVLPGESIVLRSPTADPAVLVGDDDFELAVADPYGGRPWVLRSWQSSQDRTCLVFGRAIEDEVGRLTDLGHFIEAPRTTSGNCATVPPGVAATAAAATAATSRGDANLQTEGYLFVYGLSGDDVVSITGTIGDRRIQVVRSADRTTFLAVTSLRLREPFARELSDRLPGRLRLTVRSRNGATTVLRPGIGLPDSS
jgi:hypothetical protein